MVLYREIKRKKQKIEEIDYHSVDKDGNKQVTKVYKVYHNGNRKKI